jgi:uncharacterized protein with HEPN domain
MSKRDSRLLLDDILLSIDNITEYTNDLSFDEFLNDSKTLDAVIRNFEIIGEAANRLPVDIKDEYPLVDWHRMRGFRNRIVRDYMGIDFQMVWLIKENFLPALKNQIQSILNDL